MGKSYGLILSPSYTPGCEYTIIRHSFPSFLKLRTLDAFPPYWHHYAADNLAWDSYAHPVS
jgi:hypothetical protein